MSNSVRWISGSALLLAGAAAAFLWPSPRTPSTPPAATGTAAPVTARLKQDGWHPWPLQPEVVGAPRRRAAAPAAAPVEPAAPTPAEVKKESLRALTPEEARAILLDPKKSSTLKLAVLEKLRGQPPEKVVLILVAVLQAPAGGSAVKPSAVKLLADLKHPLAAAALADLSGSSTDERVRVTIASLRAKENVR